MTKQKGRLLLIKIGDGEVAETFTVLCGLNSKTFTINNSEIDVTTADCDDPGADFWTEVLAGVKRVSVSGNGYFKDVAGEQRMNSVAMSDDPHANFEVIVPGFGTFAGRFFLSEVEYGGEATDGVTYGLSMASSGKITFTAL